MILVSDKFWHRSFIGAGTALLLMTGFTTSPSGWAANSDAPPSYDSPVQRSLADALSPKQWRRVEEAVDKALVWMAGQQSADGAFHSIPAGQPAVTGLAVLALLSRGHTPQLGQYGKPIHNAIEFVLSCQHEDGLFSLVQPESTHNDKRPSHGATYSHAIAGLMLSEVYGMSGSDQAQRIRDSVFQGLAYSRKLQTRPKVHSRDLGGWRYLWLREGRSASDSDMLVTAWQLMFLRAAKNAEFDVPQEYIDDAMAFIRRHWIPQQGIFIYSGSEHKTSRGVMGAGILSFSLAGLHQTPIAHQAGDWVLRNPVRQFGQAVGSSGRFFYGIYYCSQAMAQLGGDYWQKFYPSLVEVLLANQQSDGSWPAEPRRGDSIFGNVYTTALAVLALTPPLQILPVYQR